MLNCLMHLIFSGFFLLIFLPCLQFPLLTDRNCTFSLCFFFASIAFLNLVTPYLMYRNFLSASYLSIACNRAQVVGWPPIRSFRKNTLATNSSKNNDVEGKPDSSCIYVKVSMDGAPYLRKVDLKNYFNYAELSAALEKMFSGFTSGLSLFLSLLHTHIHTPHFSQTCILLK